MTPQRGLVSDRTPCLGQAGRSLLPTLGPRGKARRGPRGPGPEPQGSEQPRRHPQPPGAGRHASAAPGLGGLMPRWCCSWGDFAQMCARVYTRVYVLIQPGHDTRVCLCLCTRTHKPGSHKPAQARVVKGHGALCGPGGVWSHRPGTAPARARAQWYPKRLLRPSSVPPQPKPLFPQGLSKGWRDRLSPSRPLWVSRWPLPTSWSGGLRAFALLAASGPKLATVPPSARSQHMPARVGWRGPRG